MTATGVPAQQRTETAAKGEAVILQVYCPDERPQHQDRIDELSTATIPKP